MIHRIFSSLPSFKELELTEGLNVLLAEQSPGASELQTRNRSGKTSLIEVVHAVLGGDLRPSSPFRGDALVEYEFGLSFDLAGETVEVRRSGSDASRIVVGGEFDLWPQKPVVTDGEASLSNVRWRDVLGELMFGLGSADDDTSGAFSPTFRSLFSYFVRRERAGGFRLPFKQSEQQLVWDQQVAISFLIGTDWTIPQQLQVLRQREKSLVELKRAGREGTLGPVIGTAAELRTELAVLEDQARQQRRVTEQFEVLPQYRQLEVEASGLAQQIAALSNDNTLERQLVAQLEGALEEEAAPTLESTGVKGKRQR